MTFEYNNQKYKLIIFCLSGSRFYGTHYDGRGSVDEDGNSREHPFKPDYKSDSDYRGIMISHPDTKLGLTNHVDQIEVKKGKDGKVPEDQQKLIKELNEKLGMDMPLDEDIVLYEIKKFVSLALENNPNILDVLFADNDSIIYKNKKGKKLLKNRDIFISKKTKFTFSGYAISQLQRIKGHNKWITQYPKTDIVIKELKDAFEKKEIDYNFITDHFGGNVSAFVTGIKQQDANELGKVEAISWEKFVELHSLDRRIWETRKPPGVTDEEHAEAEHTSMFLDEWERYRKPQLIDYVTAKDLKAKKYPLDTTEPHELAFTPISTKSTTLKEFLTTEASFRTISKTQYNIFTPAEKDFKGGIFARNGDLKANDPEKVGEFVCQISIDENNYKKDLDAIKKLWEWRVNRNEKRSVLEEHFGYDTKHGSHTVRLLLGGANILRTGEYHPRLEGDNLKMVKAVLNGEYTYKELVDMAEEMEKELEPLYKACTLQNKPNHKKANELLLELSRKF
jgi:predicted nucleotidyltransferase